MKNKELVILLLVGLLLITFSYIIYDFTQGKILQIKQEAFEEGYQFTMINLFQEASKCQQIPISSPNQTLNLIAVECFQQG